MDNPTGIPITQERPGDKWDAMTCAEKKVHAIKQIIMQAGGAYSRSFLIASVEVMYDQMLARTARIRPFQAN